MQFARSPLGGALLSLAVLLMALPAAGLEKPRLRVDDYVINADLTPAKHHLRAVAQVKFTALDDISAAVFELHNGLRVISVTSASGAKLPVERFSQENAVRVSLPDTLSKDSSSTLTFTYEGNLASADDSPVEGLKLAYVGEDISYLLYAGRWFPVSGYGVNRFTARINVAVPTGYTVIGSGKVAGGNFAGGVEETAGEEERSETPALRRKGAAAKTAETPRRKTGPFSAPGKTVFSFAWEKNSFPGTIIAGKFEQAPAPANSNVHVFFNAAHKQFAPAYAETAAKELEFFSGWYGPAPSPTLNLVELPDDTVPSAWAPEIAAIAGRAIQQKTDYRLLANAIAHQWWGASISPISADDLWLRDGGARYSEAFYVESAAGEAGFQEAMKDIEVGALAYDNIPLASIGIGIAVFVIWVGPDVLFAARHHWLFENPITGQAASSLPVSLKRNVAFILLLIGVYGLIFEFLNPGAVAPGLIGAISLLVALYALAFIPINYAGAALVLFGVALMVAEVHIGAFGALCAATSEP